MSDLQIIHKRKTGYTLKEIHDYHMSLNPCLDEIICLVHVVRVCHENNLPFGREQILRVFNRYYQKQFHMDKKSYLEFINQWASDKMLVFKKERSEKVCCRPPFFEKTAILSKENDSDLSEQGKIKTSEDLA